MSQNVQVQLIKLQFQQQTMQRCKVKLCLAARKILHLLRGLQSRMLIRFVSAWTMHRKCHLPQKKLRKRQKIMHPKSRTI